MESGGEGGGEIRPPVVETDWPMLEIIGNGFVIIVTVDPDDVATFSDLDTS